jgi:hypothetical protein
MKRKDLRFPFYGVACCPSADDASISIPCLYVSLSGYEIPCHLQPLCRRRRFCWRHLGIKIHRLPALRHPIASRTPPPRTGAHNSITGRTTLALSVKACPLHKETTQSLARSYYIASLLTPPDRFSSVPHGLLSKSISQGLQTCEASSSSFCDPKLRIESISGDAAEAFPQRFHDKQYIQTLVEKGSNNHVRQQHQQQQHQW